MTCFKSEQSGCKGAPGSGSQRGHSRGPKGRVLSWGPSTEPWWALPGLRNPQPPLLDWASVPDVLQPHPGSETSPSPQVLNSFGPFWQLLCLVVSTVHTLQVSRVGSGETEWPQQPVFGTCLWVALESEGGQLGRTLTYVICSGPPRTAGVGGLVRSLGRMVNRRCLGYRGEAAAVAQMAGIGQAAPLGREHGQRPAGRAQAGGLGLPQPQGAQGAAQQQAEAWAARGPRIRSPRPVAVDARASPVAARRRVLALQAALPGPPGPPPA